MKKTPSEGYRRFLDSMVMNFEKWHDGIGYDLETLVRLEPDEQDSIEAILIKHLEEAGDWRDVESLAVLKSASAREAVDQARFHKQEQVRNKALRILLGDAAFEDVLNDKVAEIEEQVALAVEQGDYALAEYMPTMRVKQALLECARKSRSEIRVSAAAFLMYLCGLTTEPFDWDLRPFFLLFGKSDPTVRESAWEELREKTGV